jgi:hypothetical protein
VSDSQITHQNERVDKLALAGAEKVGGALLKCTSNKLIIGSNTLRDLLCIVVNG